MGIGPSQGIEDGITEYILPIMYSTVFPSPIPAENVGLRAWSLDLAIYYCYTVIATGGKGDIQPFLMYQTTI